jgi:1-phosphatidylinositol-4-phosphate 5-kinase
LFIIGSTERCPEIVGLHEANVVFKDNDLTTKVRLKPDDAYNVLEALQKDSDALCKMGIMDYSLLIGVKTHQYEVENLHSNLSVKSTLSNVHNSIKSRHSYRYSSHGEDVLSSHINKPHPGACGTLHQETNKTLFMTESRENDIDDDNIDPIQRGIRTDDCLFLTFDILILIFT